MQVKVLLAVSASHMGTYYTCDPGPCYLLMALRRQWKMVHVLPPPLHSHGDLDEAPRLLASASPTPVVSATWGINHQMENPGSPQVCLSKKKKKKSMI